MTATGSIRSGRTLRLVLLALSVTMSVVGTGGAHPTTNGYRDTFDTLGGLRSGPADPWQILGGDWVVRDVPNFPNMPQLGLRRVVVQSSRAGTPNSSTEPLEPMAFVRGRSFKSFTAQVTAALIDNVPTASLGLVFRSPILQNGQPDGSNLYLFGAVNTDFAPPTFTTGKVFALYKRVGRGYFLQDQKIINTRFDLTLPHEYKVSVTAGRIQAFVDGRLVIDHTDKPSGDQPTVDDPFPGLPYEAGAVGLRTSKASAWFDDFTVVGTDAYETRATATDLYLSTGVSFAGAGVQGVPLGRTSVNVGFQSTNLHKAGDTGFQYHDHEFEETTVRPIPVFNGPSAGATLQTSGKAGTATSVARLTGVNLVMEEPISGIKVTFTADSIETRATANCSTATSNVFIDNGMLTFDIPPADGTPIATLGPVPLKTEYPANSRLYHDPAALTVIVHPQLATGKRVEAGVLKLIVPESTQRVGASVPPAPPFSVDSPVPGIELTVAGVVAGRYCL